MQFVDQTVDRPFVHQAVQSIGPDVEGDEIGGIFQRNHPPGGRAFFKGDPAVGLKLAAGDPGNQADADQRGEPQPHRRFAGQVEIRHLGQSPEFAAWAG